MPEKSLTVATYAAGASLAAITLIYVFGPTYLLDSNPSSSAGGFAGLSNSNRKKSVVGLANPANDCFINSVLQALAGLGDLRLYLIRETHRRSLDEAWVYAQAIPPKARGTGNDNRRDMPDWKVEGLQSGIVTKGLKDILDSLNERPIYKKTITAAPFVRSLELAFRQRISRQQQDAQEFLQVVAERLCDEYHAGRRARNFAKRKTASPLRRPDTAEGPLGSSLIGETLSVLVLEDEAETRNGHGDGNRNEKEVKGALKPTPASIMPAPEVQLSLVEEAEAEEDGEEGFPMEGKFESQIECLTCGFKPRPTESTFCTLTLNVPQTSSTTLNACFDGMFKTEYIDDFKCEKCRLLHAMSIFETEVQRSTSESFRPKALDALAKLKATIDTDPEQPPEGVVLPDLRYAPKRRIARHIRLTSFPKIMAIHLSRSIYDASHLSQKNSAKVTFPERLPLGGLLQQKKYKLLGVVTHKGSHHSGHYESFRRQNFYPPFSNPNTFQASGVYTASVSPASTPRLEALQQRSEDTSPLASTPDLLSPPSVVRDRDAPTPPLDPLMSSSRRSSPALNNVSSSSPRRLGPTSAPRDNNNNNNSHNKDAETTSVRSVAVSLSALSSSLSRVTSRPSSRSGRSGSSSSRNGPGTVNTNTTGGRYDTPNSAASKSSKRQKQQQEQQHSDRWWRISDEKIKEANTRDVLAMQREVYLLFYELERQ